MSDIKDKIIPNSKPKKKKVKQPEALPSFSELSEKKLIELLFKEKLEKEQSDNEQSPYYFQTEEIEHKKRPGEWDVLLSDEIKYFDPTLSYEVTGYRPITMTDGLDFDPRPFQEAAETYDRTGEYTSFIPGSKPFNDFWIEQVDRCVNGYSIGKYRVTGDHYFFLNFYRMQTVRKKTSDTGTQGRGDSFPQFAAVQYEWFHYIEMCKACGRDINALKSRAIGWSEILACIAARPFITTKGHRTVITAFADGQLDPTLTKIWTQLDWLALNTDGGMKRLRQKIDNIRRKRASLLDNEGIEYGSRAEIEGIIGDKANKIRGDRAEYVLFEEAGSNKILMESWIQGEALVDLGGRKIGTLVAMGTGGDSVGLDGISTLFNDPTTYNILPYKHKYTRDGKVAYTGFFIPAYRFALDEKYLDSRGVTNEIEFRKYFEDRRSKLKGQDLVRYCAERCFYPDEALLMGGDNLFNTELLSDRLMQIRVHKMVKPPQPTALLWDRREGTNSMSKVKAEYSANSKLLITEPPLLDENGEVFSNLYVAGIDAIDMGVKDSASDRDVSDFCIVIKRRQHGMMPPKYVAMYKHRPYDIREAYDLSIKLLTWYNCKALLEYTKITLQTYFTDKKKRHLLMARPQFAMPQNMRSRQQKNLIGIQATETIIKHGLELISNFVNDEGDAGVYGIDFDEMLEQLLHYSYENKRKFDIVAAMGICEIADEDMYGINIKSKNAINNAWRDIGYYTDEYGHKRYGEIPKYLKW